jgi:hypothetical protein
MGTDLLSATSSKEHTTMSRTVLDDGSPMTTDASVGTYRRGDAADALNVTVRVIAAVAAGVMTVIGLIALAKFNWSAQGLDAPAVRVAGMVFRPWIAIATTGLGVLALGASVSRNRESKLFMGAVLIAIGVAVVIADPTIERVVLTDRIGWMSIIVGLILAVAGLVVGQTWARRRTVAVR